MKTIDMTQGNPLKLLIQFSIPVLLGNLFQQIYIYSFPRDVGNLAYNRTYLDSNRYICTYQI